MRSNEDLTLRNPDYMKFLVVLDINGTLLKRIHEYDKKTIGKVSITPCSRINRYEVYYRPNLRKLSDFLNKSSNIKYAFWSSMNHRNVLMYVKSLEQFGFNKHIGCYDVSYCKTSENRGNIKAEKWVKDLKIVSEIHNIEQDNCILVDDDVLKSTDTNNFIFIKPYNLEENDNELLGLIDKIKEFVTVKITN